MLPIIKASKMFILNEPADTGKMQKSSDKFVYEYTVDVITRT